MPLEPLDFRNAFRGGNGQMRITIDRGGRMSLLKAVRNEMNINAQLSPWVTVLYDKELDMFAVQKAELLKQAPEGSSAKVDSKGSVNNIRGILRRNRINFLEEGPIHYEYDGKVEYRGETYLSFKRVAD